MVNEMVVKLLAFIFDFITRLYLALQCCFCSFIPANLYYGPVCGAL